MAATRQLNCQRSSACVVNVRVASFGWDQRINGVVEKVNETQVWTETCVQPPYELQFNS